MVPAVDDPEDRPIDPLIANLLAMAAKANDFQSVEDLIAETKRVDAIFWDRMKEK